MQFLIRSTGEGVSLIIDAPPIEMTTGIARHGPDMWAIVCASYNRSAYPLIIATMRAARPAGVRPEVYFVGGDVHIVWRISKDAVKLLESVKDPRISELLKAIPPEHVFLISTANASRIGRQAFLERFNRDRVFRFHLVNPHSDSSKLSDMDAVFEGEKVALEMPEP